MNDRQCVEFLQWALPQLNMRYKGFRRVRRQVCRRIAQRIAQLQIDNIASYQQYLAEYPAEWTHLDRMCRITISRFYRDRSVFDYFSSHILPSLAQYVKEKNSPILRVWSCGCASGEEPYTVAIIWHHLFRLKYPEIRLEILATDIDPVLLSRARRACYSKNTLRFIPAGMKENAFVGMNETYCLKQELKKYVRFESKDVREGPPEGIFQAVFCRNLAFTYFDRQLQKQVLADIANVIDPGGVLIIGIHEHLSTDDFLLRLDKEHLPIYRKRKPEEQNIPL